MEEIKVEVNRNGGSGKRSSRTVVDRSIEIGMKLSFSSMAFIFCRYVRSWDTGLEESNK